MASPAENLACDEALLSACNDGEEVLRFWEPAQYFVVLGYANKAATEANLSFCQEKNIPVLRRCTGGGTVLQGPGCLNYSLILRIGSDAGLQSISATNRYVLKRHQETLAQLLNAPVSVQGSSDLVVGGLKFSGNAQRRGKDYLIFHGSYLLDFDIGLMEKVLPMPSSQPGYRANRSHRDFLTNLRIESGLLKQALKRAWNASDAPVNVPTEVISRLVQDKYARHEWNFKF